MAVMKSIAAGREAGSPTTSTNLFRIMNDIIFGQPSPLYDPADILQGYADTCAIKSQQLILDSFGKSVSEETLCQEAHECGWYTPGMGSTEADVGKLLELHGVPVTVFDGANQYTLMHELAQGHQVIVSLDSGEMWAPGIWERLMDFLGLSGANHALIVTGIDTTVPDDVKVIVTDPGTGQVTSYPYEQFSDAWADSHFHMVATNEAPTDSAMLAGFDGMLDTIMGLPVDDWMNAFGNAVVEGVELTEQVVDFFQAHPELVNLALTAGGCMLANGSEDAAGGMMDMNL